MTEAKHVRLQQALIGKLRELRKGQRLPTVRHLMSEHGISQATVTRSLGELQRQGLIEHRLHRGYFKADPRRRPSATRLVGMVVPDISLLDRGLLVRAVEETLSGEGYRVLLGNTRENPRHAIEKMEALETHGGCGFIVSPNSKAVQSGEYVQFLNDVVRRHIPLVLTVLAVPGVAANFVGIDFYQGFYAATAKLLARGVTRLGVSTVASSLQYAERFGGVAACVQATGGVELHLLPSTWETGLHEIADRAKRLELDGLMIADARDSLALWETVRRAYQADERKIEFGVLIEEDQPRPRGDCIVLEKPTLRMGQRAAQVLLKSMRERRHDVSVFERLPLWVYTGSDGRPGEAGPERPAEEALAQEVSV